MAQRSQTTQAPAAPSQPDFNPFPFAADRQPVSTAGDAYPGHSAGDLEHPHRESLQGGGAGGTMIRLGFVNTASRTTIAQTVQAYRSEIGLVAELNGQDESAFWRGDAIRAADAGHHGCTGRLCFPDQCLHGNVQRQDNGRRRGGVHQPARR
ncbi:hypothetical protein [Leisingera sp. F5]|uniref:hypothetical protein n=1 Tax=Leisingera sp. F5 TaxID=1813816 RepID=UPI0025C23D85|nr:hypothetical protein [Leisingera sp. F5]